MSFIPMHWPIDEILASLKLSSNSLLNNLAISDIVIDSRKVQQHSIYVAIKGHRLDGHQFCVQAIEKGAAFVLVERLLDEVEEKRQILVENTQKALGLLAQMWRKKWSGRLIALTGSCGKTTVKEMLAKIFRDKFNSDTTANDTVLATIGNLNNEFGVPLSLLRLREHHQVAIIEMGANHHHEIAYLSQLADPDVALVTNAAAAHLQGFGSISGVAQAKGEIYQNLKASAVALINHDDDYFSFWCEQAKQNNRQRQIINWGMDKNADFCLSEHKNYYQLNYLHQQYPLKLNVTGKHNYLNACSAIATAVIATTLDVFEAVKSLESFENISGRLQLLPAKAEHSLVINDCYNANPTSFKAAIESLAQFSQYPHKIVIMGDMAELGEQSQSLHQQVVQSAIDAKVTRIIAMGNQSISAVNHFSAKHHATQLMIAHSQQQLLEQISEDKSLNDSVILIKGSRFMQMESIVAALSVESLSEQGELSC